MEAFGEDDDPMDYFTTAQQQQQQQQHENELRRIPSGGASKVENLEANNNIMGNGELLEEDPGDEQGNKSSSSPNKNTNANSNKLLSSDQADSKETGKDAGSWSNHATAILLDVFRDKRVAINGRNFRGEEWEELASGVNERCQVQSQSLVPSSSSRMEPWKNAKQCSYKMSNLKRKYKSEKELLQLSSGVGGGGSSWQWFPKMEAIFGGDPKYAASFAADDDFNIVNLDNHNFKSANFLSSDLPASKSASTNNLDGCSPSPRPETAGESSPKSDQLLSSYTTGMKQQVGKNKRQCTVGVSSTPLAVSAAAAPPVAAAAAAAASDLPATFAESVKLVLMQQKETLHLLRELVASKPLQRHDQELAEFGGRRDLLDLKLKIETADRELVYLKQVRETKERELKDAVQAYEDKSRFKNELVKKLLDGAYEKELSKVRRLVSMDRNLESMQQQQQHHRHDQLL